MDSLKKSVALFGQLLEKLEVEIENANLHATRQRIDSLRTTIQDARSEVPVVFLAEFDNAVERLLAENNVAAAATSQIVCDVCSKIPDIFNVCEGCPPESRKLYCGECSPLYKLPCGFPAKYQSSKMCQRCLVAKKVPFYCATFCCVNCEAEHPGNRSLREELEKKFPETAKSRNGTTWTIVRAFFNGFDVSLPLEKVLELKKVVIPKYQSSSN
jgi:NMD protein affecting ribosome stability and mRNA decay